MSNDNSKATITAADVTSKAISVRNKAENLLASVTLENFMKSDKEKADKILSLIDMVDPLDPSSISKISDWVYEEQIKSGLGSLDSIYAGPDTQGMIQIHEFQNNIETRMAPLTRSIKMREEHQKKKNTRFFGLRKKITWAIDYARDPSGKRHAVRLAEESKSEILDIVADGKTLATEVMKVKSDLLKMHEQIIANKSRPKSVQAQLVEYIKTQHVTGERSLLAMAAVKEIQKVLIQSEIPKTQERIDNQLSPYDDEAALTNLQGSYDLAVQTETYLAKGFVSAYLTTEISRDLLRLNEKANLEYTLMQSQTLNSMRQSLDTLTFQQCTDENFSILKFCHDVETSAVNATNEGMQMVYDKAKQVDQALLTNITTIGDAVRSAIRGADDFRAHEIENGVARRAAQQELNKAYAELRVASARLQSPANSNVLLADKASSSPRPESKASTVVAKDDADKGVIDAAYEEANKPARKVKKKAQAPGPK